MVRIVSTRDLNGADYEFYDREVDGVGYDRLPTLGELERIGRVKIKTKEAVAVSPTTAVKVGKPLRRKRLV